jgi:tryptophanyl-tRNA synthetase
MTKPVILTGLRANNDLHIGNYFGALLPLIDMAKSRSDEYEINLFVPDLHSFTTPIDHSKLQELILHNLKLFVAAGLPLDNDSIHIYRQSYVPAHSELTWILDCFTGFGQMSRMTQFKEKSARLGGQALAEGEEVNVAQAAEAVEGATTVGLFNYPVLMAADILLYDAKYVPVGDDQTQHLEFTRDIATRMNSKFSELFVVPEAVKNQHEFFGNEQGLRIKDLVDPTKKMSKSDDTGKGVIFLGDEPAAAAKKIKSATTDSHADGIKYDPTERAGISNLLQIYALLQNRKVSEIEAEMHTVTGYGDFKSVVATRIEEFLTDFQQRLAEVDEATLLAKLEADEVKMNEKANQTLLRAQRAVGLR